MSTLTELRADLLSLLADADNDADWPDDTLDEALRLGLSAYARQSPVVESSVTVTATGYDLDLSALGAVTIYSIAYPWIDGDQFALAAIDWRLVDGPTIRADACEFAAGEVARVRYRQRYAISGLDGALSTTVPAEDESTLLLAAAHEAYLLLYRQLSRLPSCAPAELEAAMLLADVYEKKFIDALTTLSAAEVISWGDIGL